MTKIIQISDTHIVPAGARAYDTVDTAAALRETVATVNRLLPQIGPVDLVLVTGDLTEHGTQEEYTCFKDLMAGLAIPCRAVPGNHDRREVMRACFHGSDWAGNTGPLNWSLDLEDFSIIALDSAVDGAAHGVFTAETLAFLKNKLAQLDGKPVLIGFHHPPFEVGIAPMDRHNLIDSDAFAAAISDYCGELRLVCGHLHRSITGLLAGHLCQVCPGTSHAVTLDQRADNGNSLTMEPGGFLLHEWRNGRFLSHLIPVGSFAGPHPFSGYSAEGS